MKRIETTLENHRLRTSITDGLWEKLQKHIEDEFNGRRGALGLIVEKALQEYLERHGVDII